MVDKEKTVEKIVEEERHRLLVSRKFLKYIVRFFYYEQILPRTVDETTALLAKYCYLLIRQVDDVADGDNVFFPDDFRRSKYLRAVQFWLLTDEKKLLRADSKELSLEQPYILPLYAEALRLFAKKGIHEDIVRGLFQEAINPIIVDYNRTTSDSEKHVLTQVDLEQHFYDSFAATVDMMFISMGEDLRVDDLPVLSYGQGLISSLSNLKKDWQRGVKNIPMHILNGAKVLPESTYEEVINNERILKYFLFQIHKLKPQLKQARVKIKELKHPESRRMANHILNNIVGTLLVQEVKMRWRLSRVQGNSSGKESQQESSL